jgi:hypothetical protein
MRYDDRGPDVRFEESWQLSPRTPYLGSFYRAGSPRYADVPLKLTFCAMGLPSHWGADGFHLFLV